MNNFVKKILSLLHIRQKGVGLEVSDEVVRVARFNGKVWQMDAVRLEPGVLVNGRIQKRPEFVAALDAFKTKLRKGKGKNVNVVVCLSSLQAYTQVFSLPSVKGENLEKAVELNLQMASPLGAGESYSGWRVVGRDEHAGKVEVLASFIEKKAVDEMVDALFEAGFLAMAVETRALSLTRVLREKGAGVDAKNAHLFINIDNTGLELLIVRHSELYFEYASPWHDLADEKGEIPEAKFEAALAGSVRQMTNFYRQHWTDPLADIIFSTVALEAQAERVIAESATVPAVRLTLIMGKPVSSEWLVALGASIRGMDLMDKEKEVNLLGAASLDRFREEQLLHFMRFWRVVVPVTMGLLVATFFGGSYFLSSTKTEIEMHSNINVNSANASEIATLTASSTAFNQQVALVAAAEGRIIPSSIMLADVSSLAANTGIALSQLSFQSFGAPITLSGTASSEDRVQAFQAGLAAIAGVSDVNLPLANVQTQGNTVAFSLTFVFTPAPNMKP
jgi:Tfp pilus assembly protein PilN